MKLLAIETSTEACSAALYLDGDIQESFELAPREHTKRILPMIEALMAEAQLIPQQLDGVAFSCGPGSFTGVRIATGITHGIALGADLPVVPVSTLASIAQTFFNNNAETLAFTAMDARMSEIFWGVYEKDSAGYAQLIDREAVTPAMDIQFPSQSGVGIGTGFTLYHESLTFALGNLLLRYEIDHLPRAAAIAQLGAWALKHNQAVSVEKAQPTYLRDKVAKKTSER
ncbi:MAG: tRNA (adenosine(37)-N6)-threonylcarbamoyltransferase complex dimerization subunit type 1 TsaB [Methylococcales bacterium]|nr:tRNA (adenosine(37)-N6)-threonylcarbamoyltransferase complex dimerization subunit type 1 TsaB [Methylococcales bacterium]